MGMGIESAFDINNAGVHVPEHVVRYSSAKHTTAGAVQHITAGAVGTADVRYNTSARVHGS